MDEKHGQSTEAGAPASVTVAEKPATPKSQSEKDAPTEDTNEQAPDKKPEAVTADDVVTVAAIVPDSPPVGDPPPAALVIPDTAVAIAPLVAQVPAPAKDPAPLVPSPQGDPTDQAAAPITALAPVQPVAAPSPSAAPKQPAPVDFGAILSAGATGRQTPQSDSQAKSPTPVAAPNPAPPAEPNPKPVLPGFAAVVPPVAATTPDPVAQASDQSTNRTPINPLLSRLFDPSAGGDNNIRVSLAGNVQAAGNGVAPRSLLNTGTFAATGLTSGAASSAGSSNLAQLATAVQPTAGDNAADLGSNLPVPATSSGSTEIGSPSSSFNQPFSALLGADSMSAQPNAAQAAPQTAAVQARIALPYIPAAEQIAAQLGGAFRDGIDQIRIRLQPAELGHVEVKLDLHKDGSVHAVISAQRQDTLDMLQRDAKTLERALQDSGLKADAGSLSFNLRGDGGNASGNTGRDFAQSHGAVELPPLTPQSTSISLPGTVRTNTNTGLNILV